MSHTCHTSMSVHEYQIWMHMRVRFFCQNVVFFWCQNIIRIESLLHVGCYNIFYIFTTQECEHSESLLHVGCYNIELLLHVGCYNILYNFTTQECEHSECLLHEGCHNIVYTCSHQNLSTFLCCVYMPQRLVQHIPAAQQCTGWPRCIGCLKLQVISRERANNHRVFSRKMTYKDKAFYASSPPCRNLFYK